MTKNVVETDNVVEMLVRESNLTLRQLEAVIFYYSNIDRKIIKDGYVEFKGEKVPKGAFFRILNQAKANIRKAFVTLLIMAYLGLIDINQLNVIMQLNGIMMQLKDREGRVSEELLNAFMEKIKTTIDFRKRVK